MKVLKYVVVALVLAAGFSACVVESRPGYYRHGHGHPPRPPHHYHGHWR
ncbi:hypothetical protein [Chitinophaga sp. sic0106]|nr:hypothetical protein [Chitinophaga sp. sic0106]MBV7531821.1 hypothetical protein [Chitinophaga sp. sic0106]